MLRSSPAPQPDPRAATLLPRLRAQGLHADLAASQCCGERDLRICVRRDGPGPSVELLCRAAGEPLPAQWHAVRLTGDERTVWRGPDCDDDVDGAVAFVEALLDLDEAALRRRYLPMG